VALVLVVGPAVAVAEEPVPNGALVPGPAGCVVEGEEEFEAQLVGCRECIVEALNLVEGVACGVESEAVDVCLLCQSDVV